MSSRRARIAAVVGAVVGLLSWSMAPAMAAAPSESGGERVKIIGVFHDSVDDPQAAAQDIERRHKGSLDLVYSHALEGFAGEFPRGSLSGIERDARVDYVELDQVVTIAADETPTGVERIFADDNTNIDIDGTDDKRVDVDVAVIDTGIDDTHPDLNVVAGTDCSGGSPWKKSCEDGFAGDGNGHGTHVAGTVAAIDDGLGVVGVAPGARLHAVKVLSNNGSGYMSWIVAGIDWVTARAHIIEVANMSLGCECSSDSLDAALAKSVDAGVVHVVAAGNSDMDVEGYSPAGHPDVLTVSALADFDGAAGGNGTPTCRDDKDDTLADFSNWGSGVEIAAPGVCIRSTVPGGGYATYSGTSMASPHAAGAAALLASGANDPTTQSEVETIKKTLHDTGNYDWTDDSGDGTKEPLLDVSNTTVYAPALISGTESSTSNSAPTASFTYSCTDLDCSFDGTGSSDPDNDSLSYAWDFGDGATATGATPTHSYGAAGDYTVTLTVSDGTADDSESKVVSVTTSGNSAPTASFTYDCTGSLCSFDATSSSDPDDDTLTYSWDFGDGVTSTGVAVDHTYTSNGKYDVVLTVTDTSSASDSATGVVKCNGRNTSCSPG